MSPLLEVSHLKKTFYVTPSFSQLFREGPRKNAIPVLTDVSLSIDKGEVYCLMGPNGAGKTTFLKSLCGLVLPDAGDLFSSGEPLLFDSPQLKTMFGLVTGEERSFYWRLTGRQNLEFFSAFFPLAAREAKRKIEELASLLDIENFLDKLFLTFSSGIRQRFALCRALLGNPEILFLDEPTRSLDPEAAEAFRNFMRKKFIDEKGKTLLYTTHSLEEAKIFSDRIGILHEGRMVAEGNWETLKRQAGGGSPLEVYHFFLRRGGPRVS